MKVTWMSYFVLLQSEAWRNVQKIVAGHELQVQASDSNNNMTSLYTANVVLQKWNKKPYMSSTGKKKNKQTNKGMRVWGDGGGERKKSKGSYIFWINSQVLAEFFYSPDQGQWCPAHLGLCPSKKK